MLKDMKGLIILTRTGHSTSQKTVKFFNENGIDFTEKRITNKNPFEIKDIIYLVERLTYIEKILAERSALFSEVQKMMDSEDMKLSDFIQFLIDNPTAIRFPIIFDEKRIFVGYDEDELGLFFPRSKKYGLYLDSIKKSEQYIDIMVPKDNVDHNLKQCILKAIEGKFDRTTEVFGEYKMDMSYDGYGIDGAFFYNDKHFASWDSFDKRITYFTEDLLIVGKLVATLKELGYSLKNVTDETEEFTFNWQDFCGSIKIA